MAFVRTRGTTTGLIEAYRDENGRPRQRLLANLHGEPDTLSALAKLAARRKALRTELDALGQDDGSEPINATAMFTGNILARRQNSAWSGRRSIAVEQRTLLARYELWASSLIEKDAPSLRNAMRPLFEAGPPSKGFRKSFTTRDAKARVGVRLARTKQGGQGQAAPPVHLRAPIVRLVSGA